jgi:GWxTD domain-containing protein
VAGFWFLAESAATAADSETLRVWAEGPVQWLLLPEERRQFRHLDDEAEVAAFIESFWQRRSQAVHGRDARTFREVFSERVKAADLLYSDEGMRGSLTDRGRALIVLGSPTHITISTEPVMAWDPARDPRDRVTMRDADIEIWGYRLEDLPPRVLETWQGKKKAGDDTLALTLRFRKVGRRTSLVEGETLLDAAVQAAVLISAEE